MYKRTVLDNGLRVVTGELPHTHSASVSIFVGAGSRYEADGQAGVSHFLEHMLFKGTERRPTPREVSAEIEGIGGLMNAAADKEQTVYWVKVGDQHFEHALEVLADNLLHSLFEPSEIEKERQVIVEELDMTEDSPADLVGLLIDEVLWPDQPLGRDPGGSPASVRALARADLLEYLHQQYVQENAVLAVAGNVTPDQVVRSASKHLGDWRRSTFGTWQPAVNGQTAPRVRVRQKKTEQAHVCLGLPAYGADHPDRFALDALNTVLGDGMSSRLFEEIREKRALAYDVHSYVERFADTGSVVVAVSVEPKKAVETVEVILEQLDGLKEPVPEIELNKAREYLKGRLQLRMEDTGATASWLGRQELLKKHILSVEEVLNILDGVTSADLRRVADDLLRPELVNVAVVGPFRSPARFETAVR